MTHCNNIDEKIHLGCGSDCKVDVTDRKQRDREEAGGVVSKNKAFLVEQLIKNNVLYCIQMYPDKCMSKAVENSQSPVAFNPVQVNVSFMNSIRGKYMKTEL